MDSKLPGSRFHVSAARSCVVLFGVVVATPAATPAVGQLWNHKNSQLWFESTCKNFNPGFGQEKKKGPAFSTLFEDWTFPTVHWPVMRMFGIGTSKLIKVDSLATCANDEKVTNTSGLLAFLSFFKDEQVKWRRRAGSEVEERKKDLVGLR